MFLFLYPIVPKAVPHTWWTFGSVHSLIWYWQGLDTIHMSKYILYQVSEWNYQSWNLYSTTILFSHMPSVFMFIAVTLSEECHKLYTLSDASPIQTHLTTIHSLIAILSASWVLANLTFSFPPPDKRWNFQVPSRRNTLNLYTYFNGKNLGTLEYILRQIGFVGFVIFFKSYYMFLVPNYF